MGMYDTIRSSVPHFKGTYQTKDLECLMCDYWIDPAGHLFEIDLSYTQDFDRIEGMRLIYVKNGNHGKVRPTYIRKYVRIYNEDEEFILQIHDGKVVAYQKHEQDRQVRQ
jgi:hypothetical protein